MRLPLAVVAALVLSALAPVPAAAAPAHATRHVAAAKYATGARAATQPAAAAQLLTYNGGPVGIRPRVYLVFWGQSWATGFNSGGYSSVTLQTYLTDFFNGIGGSPWLGSNGEYCQGLAAGATGCPFGWAPIPNPAGQLGGVLTDLSQVPDMLGTPDDSAIWPVVNRAYNQVHDAHASYLVFTPPGKDPTGFGVRGTGICGWHDFNSAAGPVAYGVVPFQPDAGAGCGMNEVFKANDAYGHGYFDGYSIIGGHEYVETLTNPQPMSANTAWADSSSNENADKCIWNTAVPATAKTFGKHDFAVQSLWSNAAAGCVMDNAHAPPVGAGRGYTILTGFGGIYTFGNARFWGVIDYRYQGQAVGLAEMPDGAGYSILTAPGGIYSFGDAPYFGNLIDHHYPGPAASLSETPDGGGYALLTSAGAVYNFGNSQYFGNLLDHKYGGTAVAIAYTSSGFGYYILTAQGGLYTFGDAPYRGNLLDHPGYQGQVIGLAVTKDGLGYSILTTSGAVYSFGDALYFGNLLDGGYPGPAVAISVTP